MARLFDDASSDYAEVAAAVVTGRPISISAWIRADAVPADMTVVSIADTAARNYWELLIRSASTVRFREQLPTGAAAATTTATISLDTWHQVGGYALSNTDRGVYLDGANKATNTSNLAAPSSLDVTAIGRRGGGVDPSQFFSGRGAEVGIWDVQLSDDEFAALGAGVPPWSIRPHNLAGYWPLMGVFSPEVDYTSGQHAMTLTGTARADHPPVTPWWRPVRGSAPLIEVVVAGGRIFALAGQGGGLAGPARGLAA